MTGWQWHQLDYMQIICTLLQTDNHASTSSLIFFRLDVIMGRRELRPGNTGNLHTFHCVKACDWWLPTVLRCVIGWLVVAPACELPVLAV